MISQTKKQQTAKTTSIPAPIKGLNARDSIAQMEPTYALILDNYFCTPTTVDTRNGSTNWATGITGWVETISHYTNPTTQTLFAAAGTKVYNVTTSGVVGAAVVTAMTNARYQWTNFATPGGQYLYMVNGADTPLLWDGSAWVKITAISTPAITGVTPSNLISVNAFKNRLYFIEKNSLKAWFLPLQSVGGAASAYDFSSIFTKGGYLMAMATWTIDSSSSIDEYAVFITSEGQAAVYQGYDPTFAATWNLVGIFNMGRPIGRRCWVKIGSDVAVICADGLALLSKELTTDRSQSATLSYNIMNLISNDVQSYASNFGWECAYYPLGNKVILNVPQVENNTQYQYVMNTITGAWSTWGKESSALNAACWDVFRDNVYYGGNGVVVKADDPTTLTDNGASIRADVKPAFGYFGDLGQSKLFTMVRPIIISSDVIKPTFALCLDYNDTVPIAPPNSTGTGTPWDTSPWDTSSWGASGGQVNKNWLTVGGIGYSASLRMATLTNGLKASLQSIDYVYEAGGVL